MCPKGVKCIVKLVQAKMQNHGMQIFSLKNWVYERHFSTSASKKTARSREFEANKYIRGTG